MKKDAREGENERGWRGRYEIVGERDVCVFDGEEMEVKIKVGGAWRQRKWGWEWWQWWWWEKESGDCVCDVRKWEENEVGERWECDEDDDGEGDEAEESDSCNIEMEKWEESEVRLESFGDDDGWGGRKSDEAEKSSEEVRRVKWMWG